MPIEFIPNQPYIFDPPLADQVCLNNDTKQYQQLVADGDTICIQQKMTPCNAEINCEPTMSDGAGTSAVGAGTLTGGWSSAGLGLVSYDGTGGVVGTCSFVIADPVTAVAGRPYYITFTIASITGNCAITIQTDLQSSTLTYSEPGTYTLQLIPASTSSSIELVMDASATTAGDTMEITGLNFYSVSSCWVDAIVDPDGLTSSVSWRYTLDTDNFLTYAIGKFCSILPTGGDLVNLTAYTTDGNYHRVNFRITDCTAGGVEVILGGTYLGTTSGNGEFSYYGIPNDASGELRFRKAEDFDGCIDNCTVDDFGLLDTADPTTAVLSLRLASDAGSAISDKLPFTLFDDRITWCFSTNDIELSGSPIDWDCDEIYRFLIVDACDALNPIDYVSDNGFRYATTWDCTYVVEGYSAGYNLGFYFGATTAPEFKLIQRLRVLQFAPRYPSQGEEYLYSDGTFERSFAQRGKVREAWFDYVDEYCHDVISTQILCDVLTIGGKFCFAPVKDYEPEWDEHRQNLAQSRIDLILVSEETIFKRNC